MHKYIQYMCICVPFNDVHFIFSSGLSFCGTVKDHNFQLCFAFLFWLERDSHSIFLCFQRSHQFSYTTTMCLKEMCDHMVDSTVMSTLRSIQITEQIQQIFEIF